MGEVFLDKTISLLSSDKQKARSDGLAGLILSISSHRKNTGANPLGRLKAHLPAE